MVGSQVPLVNIAGRGGGGGGVGPGDLKSMSKRAAISFRTIRKDLKKRVILKISLKRKIKWKF